jgi:hypothetical protein
MGNLLESKGVTCVFEGAINAGFFGSNEQRFGGLTIRTGLGF